MNREERIRYLEEHQDEVDAQIKRMLEDDKEIDEWFIPLTNQTNALLGKPPITAEEWHKNWIYSKVEGENTNDEPTVDGIDLTPYLDMIRYDRIIEHMITLCIKDGKVIEMDMMDGNSREVNVGEEKNIFTLKRAKELGASIYQVHSHAQTFVAKPSPGDEKYIERFHQQAKEIGAEIADIGIVTIDDYYSYKKSLDK